MFSFYRKHIPQYAQFIEPLQLLLNSSKSTQKKRIKSKLLLKTMETTYDWLPQHSETFSALKEGLSKSVLLNHVSPDTTLSLRLILQKQLLVQLSMRYPVRTKTNH